MKRGIIVEPVCCPICKVQLFLNHKSDGKRTVVYDLRLAFHIWEHGANREEG